MSAVSRRRAAITDIGVGWPVEVWGDALVWSALELLGRRLVMFASALPAAKISADDGG